MPTIRGAATNATVAALMLAAGAGCTSSGATATLGAAPIPTLLRSTDLHLPLDTYLLSVSDLDRIGQARRVLTHGCMQRLGYSFPPLTPGIPTGPSTWNERRYGVTDPAMAARYGYGLGPRDPASHPGRPDETGANTPTTAQLRALDGSVGTVNGVPVPAGGCTGQANRHLAGGETAADVNLPQQLSSESFARSSTDPAVTPATAAWSRCMQAAGYRYTTALDPPGDPRWSRVPRSTQIATANRDVSCKRQANLVGIWFTVEAAYQRQLIADHRTALALVHAAKSAQLAAATRLVEGP
ncbi:MAG: hypothetical protein ACQSGP_04295 [Frankia sp.]